jgi:hypothetical protein
MFKEPTMAIVWLMTPAMVAISGFCAGLALHAISTICREAVFVFLRRTLEPDVQTRQGKHVRSGLHERAAGRTTSGAGHNGRSALPS